MFKNPWFKPCWGEYRTLGEFSTTDFPLSEANAAVDHARGHTLIGKCVALDWANKKCVYQDGYFYGVMEHKVSLNGVLTDAWYLQTQRQTDVKDPPLRRGAMAVLRVYEPGAFLEFEGVGAASVETNVVTAGAGLLAAGTAIDTELSVIKGGWRVAQVGEFVMGLLKAILVPEDTITPSLRILVQLTSPYKKA